MDCSRQTDRRGDDEVGLVGEQFELAVDGLAADDVRHAQVGELAHVLGEAEGLHGQLASRRQDDGAGPALGVVGLQGLCI